MNPRKTTITILGILSASLTLADDFKTVNGKETFHETVGGSGERTSGRTLDEGTRTH